MARGCVIIGQHSDSAGAPCAVEAALKEGGVAYSVGYNLDMRPVAPTAALTSAQNNWEVYFEYALSQVLAGDKIAADWCGGYAEGANMISALGKSCASGTAKKVAEVEANIKDGSLKIFDTANFTVGGAAVTSAPVDMSFGSWGADGFTEIYHGDTVEAIVDGAFSESTFRSAPYFALRIDGITELGDSDPEPVYITISGTAAIGENLIAIPDGGMVGYAFTPEESGQYLFTSYGEEDTYAMLLDENFDTITENDDSGDAANFLIMCNLEAGKTYYICVRYYDSYAGTIAVYIEQYEHTYEDEPTIVASGYCGGEGDGTNLTWTLDSDGVLTISGEGKMQSCAGDGLYEPWGSYCSKIKSIIICSGVTRIEDWAFAGCDILTSVIIPESVTYIGAYVFHGCDTLTSISIPKGVNSVQGALAFKGCNNLNNISVSAENKKYSSLDGILYNKNGTALICCPEGKDYATILDGVTSIEESAFESCRNLLNVTIPESVIDISYNAFGNCSNLTSIKIPDGITVIRSGAFYNCSKLRDIIIPSNVTKIESCAFSGCNKLESVTIPNSVMSIQEAAFFDCGRIKTVYYNGTQAQWNAISIDRYNDNLKNATIRYTHVHQYIQDAVIIPTCTEQGYTTHTCVCGDSYVDNYTEALGHRFVDGKCVVCGCPAVLPGDVNGDGEVTDADAVYLLYNTFFGDEEYPVSQPCDFNGDGEVTDADAVYLLYYTFFGAEEYPLH